MQLAFILYKCFPVCCGSEARLRIARAPASGLHPGYVCKERV